MSDVLTDNSSPKEFSDRLYKSLNDSLYNRSSSLWDYDAGYFGQNTNTKALERMLNDTDKRTKVLESLVETSSAPNIRKTEVEISHDEVGRVNHVKLSGLYGEGTKSDPMVNRASYPIDIQAIERITSPNPNPEIESKAKHIEEIARNVLVDHRLGFDDTKRPQLIDAVSKAFSNPNEGYGLITQFMMDNLTPGRNIEVHPYYSNKAVKPVLVGVGFDLVTECGPRMIGHQFSKNDSGYMRAPDEVKDESMTHIYIELPPLPVR